MKEFKDIKFCIQCQYHKIVPDPDPDDWFNDDDEAILCTVIKSGINDKSYSGIPYPFKMISGSNRPYETKKVEKPEWCPYHNELRLKKIQSLGKQD